MSAPSRFVHWFRPLWPHAFIAGFIVVQLALPLHYYLVRRDRHDERFAWRMFSSTRMLTCRLAMTRDETAVELPTEFHDAWLALVQRGRLSVIEAMGARLCHLHPGSRLRATLTCTPLRGAPYALSSDDLCRHPRLRR